MSIDISTQFLPYTAITASRPAVLDFVSGAPEWDRLVAQASFPHLPQSFAYGEGKRAKGWTVRRAVFSRNNRIEAFATVMERRLAGLRLLTRVNRGPVFLEARPQAESIVAVYRTLRRHWRGPLLIAPALELSADNGALLRAAGFRLRHGEGWLSGRIDLRRTEQDLWAGLSSSFRNRVRNSVKAGALLRLASDTDTYEWMLARHAENMRDKGFTAADATLLRALREAAPQNVSVFQLLHAGAAVAGMSVVRFGDSAEYHIGWFGPEGRRLNAGNFLMWEIIKELRRQGVTQFDVGGMRPGDGYTQFKRTMRPVEFRLAGEWMSF